MKPDRSPRGAAAVAVEDRAVATAVAVVDVAAGKRPQRRLSSRRSYSSGIGLRSNYGWSRSAIVQETAEGTATKREAAGEACKTPRTQAARPNLGRPRGNGALGRAAASTGILFRKSAGPVLTA